MYFFFRYTSSEPDTGSRDDKRKQRGDSELKSASKFSGKERALRTRWDSAPAEPNQLNFEQNNVPSMLNEGARSTRQEREIPANVSGAATVPIFRDRRTGKIRNPKKEAEEKRKQAEKDEMDKEKYNKWGRGVKQVEDEQEKLNNELYEMSKPLARYADDADLEKYLKEKEREGDPMLAYIRRKKKMKAIETGKPGTSMMSNVNVLFVTCICYSEATIRRRIHAQQVRHSPRISMGRRRQVERLRETTFQCPQFQKGPTRGCLQVEHGRYVICSYRIGK